MVQYLSRNVNLQLYSYKKIKKFPIYRENICLEWSLQIRKKGLPYTLEWFCNEQVT